MTDEQLRERCEFWQQILRLQDWRIHVGFADSGEMNGDQGRAHFQKEKRLGVIRLLRPEAFDQTDDYHKGFPDIFDPDRTLLHELIHAPLDGLFVFEESADEFKHTAPEQFIEAITDALYQAYAGSP